MNLADALDDGPDSGGSGSGNSPWSGQPGGGGGGGAWPGGGGGGGAWPGGGGTGPKGQSGGGGGWPGSGGQNPKGKHGSGGPWVAGGGTNPKGGLWPGGGFGGGSSWFGGQSGGGSSGGNQFGGGSPGGSQFGGGSPGGSQFGGGSSGGSQFGGGDSSRSGPSPTVPFRLNIPDGCYEDLEFSFCGTINPNADKFTVDFCSNNDIPFHFNPRFNDNGQKVIVMNNCCGRRWGKEQRETINFPFSPGRSFKMKMKCTKSGFEVKVDESPDIFFKHRSRMEDINRVNIYNDLSLSDVSKK